MDFRFLFLADCQLGAYATFSGFTDEEIASYAERDMRVMKVPRTEGFEWDSARYEAAMRVANVMRPAFVVVGGDMVDDAAAEGQLEELLRVTALLDDDIPMMWVPGNHDIAADATVPTAHSIDKYRETFGADYYAFDWGSRRFLALNTVVLDHPELVPDHLDEQLEWLQAELERADYGSVLLLGHHPLFLDRPDEPDTYWNLPSARREKLLELVHRFGVSHAFAGHWHRNSIASDGDFEMVTSGPVGYPLGVDPPGYRVVDVGEDELRHEYHALDA